MTARTDRPYKIIDNHIHCGDNSKPGNIDMVMEELSHAGVGEGVIFAFPEDMYRWIDTPASRKQANEYVLDVSLSHPVYPFYFVWNDYVLPPRLDAYCGIKWHRHWDEPRYDYSRAGDVLRAIKDLDLVVLIEEEADETNAFIRDNPELNVIIPHMANLNGGLDALSDHFDNPKVYWDTSMAEAEVIETMLKRAGAERVIFGSDLYGTRTTNPGHVARQLDTAESLGLTPEHARLVFRDNILKLMHRDT